MANLLSEIHSKKVDLFIGRQGTLRVMSVFAEFERSMIHEGAEVGYQTCQGKCEMLGKTENRANRSGCLYQNS